VSFQSPTPRPDADRAQACDALQPLVANGVALTLAAQDAHWNVKGPAFGPMHALFGEVYDTASDLVDRIAERVVTLGGTVSGMSVMGSRPVLATTSGPANHDGLALCASLAELLRAYVVMLDESYRLIEGLRMTADANALQDAVESLEKLGWKLAAHVA